MNVRVAALVLVAVVLGGCGVGEEVVFGEYPAPGGSPLLRVTVAESNYPQGPRHVMAYLGATRLFDTTLANDGVPFSGQNIAVRWVSPRQALVCLRATDLPDRGYRIEVTEPPRVVETDRC